MKKRMTREKMETEKKHTYNSERDSLAFDSTKESTHKYRKKSDLEEIEDLDGLNNDELIDEYKKEKGIDDDEWDHKVNSEPIFGKETVDEIANIPFFVEKLENNLRGRTLDKKGKNENVYKQTGVAIASNKLIKRITGVLDVHTHQSLLIAGGREEDFNMQMEDAFYKLSDDIMDTHTYLDISHHRNILKQFKDILWKIGDLRAKSGKNMDNYFNNLRKKYEEADERIKSRFDD